MCLLRRTKLIFKYSHFERFTLLDTSCFYRCCSAEVVTATNGAPSLTTHHDPKGMRNQYPRQHLAQIREPLMPENNALYSHQIFFRCILTLRVLGCAHSTFFSFFETQTQWQEEGLSARSLHTELWIYLASATGTVERYRIIPTSHCLSDLNRKKNTPCYVRTEQPKEGTYSTRKTQRATRRDKHRFGIDGVPAPAKRYRAVNSAECR